MEKAQTGNEHRQVEQQEEGYLHAEKGVTVTTFTREQVKAAIADSSHRLLTKLKVHGLVTTTVNVRTRKIDTSCKRMTLVIRRGGRGVPWENRKAAEAIPSHLANYVGT